MPQGQASTPVTLEQENFVQEVLKRARIVASVIFEQAMEEELIAFLQAFPYQRSPEHKGSRNG